MFKALNLAWCSGWAVFDLAVTRGSVGYLCGGFMIGMGILWADRIVASR